MALNLQDKQAIVAEVNEAAKGAQIGRASCRERV